MLSELSGIRMLLGGFGFRCIFLCGDALLLAKIPRSRTGDSTVVRNLHFQSRVPHIE